MGTASLLKEVRNIHADESQAEKKACVEPAEKEPPKTANNPNRNQNPN